MAMALGQGPVTVHDQSLVTAAGTADGSSLDSNRLVARWHHESMGDGIAVDG